jgi:hypothetical protein
MLHKHHIVPRYAGGTDDPTNLVELTVPAHAEAHRLLYEQHGKLQDKLAWLLLSRMTEEAEQTRLEILRSPEVRAKMRLARLGKSLSPESRAKVSAYQTGRTRSAETCAKISVAKKGCKNPHLGRERSLETRAKISAYQTGRTRSAETRAKISAARKHKQAQNQEGNE